MSDSNFYNWFDDLSPKLQIRKDSFYKIFQYLDKMPDPIICNIIEWNDHHEGDYDEDSDVEDEDKETPEMSVSS